MGEGGFHILLINSNPESYLCTVPLKEKLRFGPFKKKLCGAFFVPLIPIDKVIKLDQMTSKDIQ